MLLSLLDNGVTVLTASRRLAYSLRLRYAKYAQEQGRAVWRTPQVLPWSAWLRQQWLLARAQAENSAGNTALRLLTSAQSRVLWNEVVADSPSAESLLNPASAARLAAHSWQRMLEFLIPLDALADSSSVEVQAMHQWALQYLSRCEALHAIDEARLAHWAFDTQLMPSSPVVFAGFDQPTPAQSRLAGAWRAGGMLEDFEDVQSPSTAIKVIAAADARDELQLAARWARASLESGGGSIGIVIADLQQRRDEVRRVFEDVFNPAGRSIGVTGTMPVTPTMPVTIAATEPLAAYPMIDAAILCLELLLGSVRSTAVGRILRSPFMAGGESERDARALADLRLRDEQRDRWDWLELERWAGMTECRQLQAAARALNALLRSDMTPELPSVWVERFHRILKTLGWPGERSASSIEHQTQLKFQSALAEFGMLDAVLGAVPLARALAQLKQLLQETAFEPEEPAAAVTVIDAATVAGMQFDVLWVAGLDATALPPPASPDPFIPLQVQRAAGVPEASPDGTFRLATLQLQRLVSSASQVWLSWPERDGDALLQPSPLLQAWPQHASADLVLASTRALPHSLFELRPSLEALADDKAPVVQDERSGGGALILELQSRCPFRAQAELRLHADRLPRVSLGVEPRDRGILLHRVLADVWSGLRDQRTLLETSEADLVQQVRTYAERHAAQVLRPATRLRRRLAQMEIDSVVVQVMGLLAMERERSPFVVHLAEQGEPFSIGGLQIRLQPDRIDDLAGGTQLLLDYKLGDSHQPRQWLDTWPGRPRRPQLPLYAIAHARHTSALAFAVLAPRTIEFRGWSKEAGVAPGVTVYPPKRSISGAPADWPALMDHWQHTLTGLAEQFVAGRAEVDPLPQECQTCHLSILCRVYEHALSDLSAGEEAADE